MMILVNGLSCFKVGFDIFFGYLICDFDFVKGIYNLCFRGFIIVVFFVVFVKFEFVEIVL